MKTLYFSGHPVQINELSNTTALIYLRYDTVAPCMLKQTSRGISGTAYSEADRDLINKVFPNLICTPRIADGGSQTWEFKSPKEAL